MENRSLHIKCRGHVIWDEGVQVGLGEGSETANSVVAMLFCLLLGVLLQLTFHQSGTSFQERFPIGGEEKNSGDL